MNLLAGCGIDCVKQLVANLAATGLWAGAALAAPAVATGATVPLTVAAVGVLAYLGLSYNAQKRGAIDRNKLRAAIDLIHRRTAETTKDIGALSSELNLLGFDILRGQDDAMTELRALRTRMDELDRLAPLAGKPDEEIRALLRRDGGLLVSIGRFMEDNFTRLEDFGIRVEATLDELKAALREELRIVGAGVERTETKVDALGADLAELLEHARQGHQSKTEIEAQVRAELEREYADKFAQERSAREAAERAAAAVMEVRDVPGIEQALREKGGQAIVDALLARVSGAQEAVIEAHRKIAEWAYLIGNIEQAERSLAIILAAHPDDLDAINRSGHIHRLKGRLGDAERCYRRLLELAPNDDGVAAVAYGNLGIVLRTRGDLVGAEAMHRKALEIEERLGLREGMASTYGNLGLVLQTRGDLDGAEVMLRKSLEINERLGRLEGVASTYGNLGLVLQTRGDLDGAEAMHRKALEINERLGRPEGMAKQYGNLGIVLQTRGDLKGAEAMLRKALEIDERLGRLEGMVSVYGNLGRVCVMRGDSAEARVWWTKALELFRRIGMAREVRIVRGWLDGLDGR